MARGLGVIEDSLVTSDGEELGRAWKGRRVLVTGAGGFLGSHLTEALTALEAKVTAVRHHPSTRVGPASAVVSVDLTDLDATRGVIAASRPEVVFHLAAVVTGAQDASLLVPTLWSNVVATVNVLEALRDTGSVRFVWAGSADEPAPGKPAASPYAASKAAARIYARLCERLCDLPVVGVCPFTVYGPGQSVNKLVPHVITSFLCERPPRLADGDHVRDFVFVRDVVRAFLAAGTREDVVGRDVDLGTGTGVSVRDIVHRIRSLTGASVEPEFGKKPARVGEPERVADVELARHLLGWSPQWSLERGLTETVAWYRDGGWGDEDAERSATSSRVE